MKIICTDNFDRESISDRLVCENISEYYGKIIVDFLNEKWGGDYGPNYYKLVPDDHKLYEFQP